MPTAPNLEAMYPTMFPKRQAPDVADLRAEGVDPSTFGKRQDGTDKGAGFLGALKRPDGGVSTEISVGVNIDGHDMEIPTMVPTLSRKEIDTLLALDPSKDEIPKSIMRKAVDHALKRIGEGKPVFATAEDAPKDEPAKGDAPVSVSE